MLRVFPKTRASPDPVKEEEPAATTVVEITLPSEHNHTQKEAVAVEEKEAEPRTSLGPVRRPTRKYKCLQDLKDAGLG